MSEPVQTPCAPDTTPPAEAEPAAAPQAEPAEPPAAKSVEDLEAEIARLRRENGSQRIQAKQNAATEAKAELAQQIGEVLGLVKGEEPVDPAKLTEQIATAGQEARQAKLELAVFRAADGAADPAALLDSRTFMQSIAALDPSDSAAVEEAIVAAVAANPRLGRPEQVGMKPNRAQGASASPPLGLNERIAAAEKAGDPREAMRLKSALLLNNPQ